MTDKELLHYRMSEEEKERWQLLAEELRKDFLSLEKEMDIPAELFEKELSAGLGISEPGVAKGYAEGTGYYYVSEGDRGNISTVFTLTSKEEARNKLAVYCADKLAYSYALRYKKEIQERDGRLWRYIRVDDGMVKENGITRMLSHLEENPEWVYDLEYDYRISWFEPMLFMIRRLADEKTYDHEVGYYEQCMNSCRDRSGSKYYWKYDRKSERFLLITDGDAGKSVKNDSPMVLLVVDTQKGITDDRLFEFHRLVRQITELISAARSRGVEVIYVRHDDGPGSGFSSVDEEFEIYDAFAPVPGEKIFDKTVNNAFHESTGLLGYLEMKGVRRVILTGLQTDFCIDATLKGGFDYGFKMIVPAYCNSTRDNLYMDAEETYRYFNEVLWPGRQGVCLPFDKVLDMIESYRPGSCDYCKSFLAPRGTEEIETERLILRKFVYEDAASMLKNWAADDKVQGMYGEPSYKTMQEVRQLLDKYIGGYESPFNYRWAVIEKASGECIGQAAYFLVDMAGQFGEIEYCIGRAYQGKGYATEATKALIRYGFDQIHFHKVQICVRPSNAASKKVIGKCGFTYEGTLRDYFYINGDFEGRMYFSILRKEWEG